MSQSQQHHSVNQYHNIIKSQLIYRCLSGRSGGLQMNVVQPMRCTRC